MNLWTRLHRLEGPQEGNDPVHRFVTLRGFFERCRQRVAAVTLGCEQWSRRRWEGERASLERSLRGREIPEDMPAREPHAKVYLAGDDDEFDPDCA